MKIKREKIKTWTQRYTERTKRGYTEKKLCEPLNLVSVNLCVKTSFYFMKGEFMNYPYYEGYMQCESGGIHNYG